MFSSEQKIVVIATGFNLLFEYSMRGINNLAGQPFLPVILIAAYSSLFVIEEELIRRFRLKDFHLVVLAFTYGSVYQCLVSGTAFLQPTVLGINWGHLLFVVIVWWAVVQAVLTFYLANRVVPRDWNRPPLSRFGWASALAINLGVIVVFQRSGAIPRGTPIGYLMMIAIFCIACLLFGMIVRNADVTTIIFERRRVMDLMSMATVAIFLFCALFLTKDPTVLGTSHVNRLATSVVVSWTIGLSVAVLIYRLVTQKPIPV